MLLELGTGGTVSSVVSVELAVDALLLLELVLELLLDDPLLELDDVLEVVLVDDVVVDVEASSVGGGGT